MAKQMRTESGEDRISDLPDGILHHILSFLPTFFAVHTSILSKRWRYVYASSPFLDFDDENFWYCDDEIRSRKAESFMNCIDRVFFFHHMSRIQRFCLKFGAFIDPGRVHGWISAAFWCDVEELCLTIYNENFTQLPLNLFTCKKLVVLKLELDSDCKKFVLTVPTNVRLPSLKTLRLENINFSDDVSTERLFSNCLMLEDLAMYNCKSTRSISIFNSKLKRLTISNMYNYTPNVVNYTPVVINAPSLLYFKYKGYLAIGHSFINLHSLVEADFYLYNHDDHQVAVDLLREISNVQSLTISCGVLQLFSYKMMPVFDKTIYLDINDPNFYLSCLKSFADLLKRLPNLETLVFSETGLVNGKYPMPSLPRRVPSCVSSQLKEIKMFSFRGKKYHMTIVKYFLKYGKVLEKFTIHIDRCMWQLEKRKLKIAIALLKLPRGSEKCQVYII